MTMTSAVSESEASCLNTLPVGGITPRAFRALAERVYGYCGIVFGPEKHTLMANRLRKRIAALGLGSYDEYAERLGADDGGAELDVFIDLMTTNHTGFFREEEHFRVLGAQVLPELARERLQPGAVLRMWSAACASGEEPYSMAMVAAQAQRRDLIPGWEILGSDISQTMLAVAERGIYARDRLQPVPPELVSSCFLQGVRSQAGFVRLDPDIRRQVRFERINLLDDDYRLGGPQHVIFCRNVMIYFDDATRAGVLWRLREQLHPGGYLFVGVSESLGNLCGGLEPVSHGVYRRT